MALKKQLPTHTPQDAHYHRLRSRSLASAVLTLLGAQGSDAAALPGDGKKNYYSKWDAHHGGKYHKRDTYDAKKYEEHHYGKTYGGSALS
ncbi:hypothetical protein HK102_000547 [Quaeritorhiza haematococci]|nr:hypothetical protein HK102_000547 [Quaeritorhiza haematococci]